MKIEIILPIRNKVVFLGYEKHPDVFILDFEFRGIFSFSTLPPAGSTLKFKMHGEKFDFLVLPAEFSLEETSRVFKASIRLTGDENPFCEGSTEIIEPIDELEQAIEEERDYDFKSLRPEMEAQGFTLVHAIEWSEKTGNTEIKL